MILLTSTSDLIQVVTTPAVTSITVHASWLDNASGTITPGRTNTVPITGATTTTVLASPGSSTQRNLKSLIIFNTHASSSCTITVQHTDGSNVETLFKYTLLAGETIQYYDTLGFQVIDASGGLKLSPATGRYLKTTIVTNTATTTFTTGTQTGNAFVTVVGGGGGGAGVAGNSGNSAAGSGGAGGGVTMKYYKLSPNTTYTIAVGAGGTAGANNANGGNGALSSFTDGTTQINGAGGANGQNMANGATSATGVGGAATAANANGDINLPGGAGGAGTRYNGNLVYSGAGGGAPAYGMGAQSGGLRGSTTDITVGGAGLNYGGGGAGGVGGANANGGAGANGCVIITEYT